MTNANFRRQDLADSKGTVDLKHLNLIISATRFHSATLWGINGQLPSYCNNVINTRKQMANIQEQGHGL
jgi:hypothetical protein